MTPAAESESTPSTKPSEIAPTRNSPATKPTEDGSGNRFRLNNKKSLPSIEAVLAKKATVRDLFGARYEKAKNSKTEKLAIAREMVKTANETYDDPVGRYALYDVAKGIFTAERDFPAAIDVIDRLHQAFPPVDHITLKWDVLEAIPRLDARTEAYTQAALQLANDCLDTGRIDAGLRMMERAKASIRRPSKPTAQLIRQLQEELDDAKTLLTEYEQQALVLEKQPSDRVALSAVGRYRCLVENKWTTDLERLANGADGPYKRTAQIELDYRDGKVKVLDLADAWFALYEQATLSFEKRRLADRAKPFYQNARVEAAGIDILKINQRIAALQQHATPTELGSSFNRTAQTSPAPNSFDGPPRFIQSRTYEHRDYKNDFASVRGQTVRLGIGNTPGGFGEAATGFEFENIDSIRVTGSATPPPARLNIKSLVGFIIDYSSPQGYSKRVLLSCEGNRHSISSAAPPWGTSRRPVQTADLGIEKEYVIDFFRWAPDDWDGRCWFSVYLRDAGQNRVMNATLQW